MHDAIFNANQIWKRMTADQKRKAISTYWASLGWEEGNTSLAIAAVAMHYHLREKTVQHADRSQQTKWMQSLAELPESVARTVVWGYLYECEDAMIIAFLEMLEIPHNHCYMDTDFNLETLQPNLVRRAGEKLRALYDKAVTDIYFGALLATGKSTWTSLADLVESGAPTLESFADKSAATREQIEPGVEVCVIRTSETSLAARPSYGLSFSSTLGSWFQRPRL
jgi:hypothetical protein